VVVASTELASTGSATEESCRRNVVVELVVVELVETTIRKGRKESFATLFWGNAHYYTMSFS